MKTLKVGGNPDLEEFSVEHCPNLNSILSTGCPKLKKVSGLDKLKKLNSAFFDEGIMNLIMSEKLNSFENITRAVGGILGLGSDEDSILNAVGNLASQDLTNRIVGATTPQLQTDKENAEKERDAVKTERDQLKQQLAEIRNELGLGEDATQQKILDEIKSLKNRPTSGCSHNDYDNIKAERDRLTSEIESKNRRISELENENKENIGITKEALTESTKSHFQKLGVKVPDESKLKNATTAQNVERIRNEIISSEFIKLKEENKSSFYLNLGLGAIALGSLILLAWVVMCQNDLPKEEPEKKKK